MTPLIGSKMTPQLKKVGSKMTLCKNVKLCKKGGLAAYHLFYINIFTYNFTPIAFITIKIMPKTIIDIIKFPIKNPTPKFIPSKIEILLSLFILTHSYNRIITYINIMQSKKVTICRFYLLYFFY